MRRLPKLTEKVMAGPLMSVVQMKVHTVNFLTHLEYEKVYGWWC